MGNSSAFQPKRPLARIRCFQMRSDPIDKFFEHLRLDDCVECRKFFEDLHNELTIELLSADQEVQRQMLGEKAPSEASGQNRNSQHST
jgi:uncharacterized protein YerC